MNLFVLIALIVGIFIGSVFNYYLNRAPGSDPEDFMVGPPQAGIRCDCLVNTLIIGGIAVVAIAISSSSFENRFELYLSGILAFTIITLAGIMGRRDRYKEWAELARVFKRAIPDVAQLYSDGYRSETAFEEYQDDFDYDEDEGDYDDEYDDEDDYGVW